MVELADKGSRTANTLFVTFVVIFVIAIFLLTIWAIDKGKETRENAIQRAEVSSMR